MPTSASVALFCVLLALTLFLWAGQLADLRQINASDSAGNALSRAFAAVLALAEWGLLAALLLMGGIKGEMPAWAALLAYVLHPASCAAAIAAGSLLSGGSGTTPPGMIVVPAVAPLMIAAYASWAFFPAFRAAVPAVAAGSFAWGVVLVLTILPWPSVAKRSHETDVRRAAIEIEAQNAEKAATAVARQENLVKLQALDPDTALWKWMEFTDPKKGVRDEAYAIIHNLARRQSDAEAMAARGLTLPLLDLPNLNLEPTAPIVKAHKDYLLELARRIRRQDAGSVQYSWIASDIDPYLSSTQWMAERHCGCGSEVAALETEVRTYQDSKGRAEALAALDKAQAAEKK